MPDSSPRLQHATFRFRRTGRSRTSADARNLRPPSPNALHLTFRYSSGQHWGCVNTKARAEIPTSPIKLFDKFNFVKLERFIMYLATAEAPSSFKMQFEKSIDSRDSFLSMFDNNAKTLSSSKLQL